MKVFRFFVMANKAKKKRIWASQIFKTSVIRRFYLTNVVKRNSFGIATWNQYRGRKSSRNTAPAESRNYSDHLLANCYENMSYVSICDVLSLDRGVLSNQLRYYIPAIRMYFIQDIRNFLYRLFQRSIYLLTACVLLELETTL